MDIRTLKALEFDKVLDALAGRCASEAGQQAALALTPLHTAAAVNAAQALFDQVRTWATVSGFRLLPFPNIKGLFSHLETLFPVGETIAPALESDALWAIRETLLQVSAAVQSIRGGETRWPGLYAMATANPLPEMAITALRRCLGDDGSLRDECSPGLMRVRGDLRSLHLQCLRKVKDFAVQYNILHYLQDEYMTLASDRYVLPLKVNFKSRIQGIIHEYSNTGETCYFEPMFLVELNNKLQELKREELEEERRVLQYLTGVLVTDLPAVHAAWELLIRLDVALAKCALAAAFAGNSMYVASEDEDMPLCLLQARHPLLALDARLLQYGGPHPVDLLFRQFDRALIISGGNAGGKTVCLKTLGLLAVMVLSGLPVPVGKGSMMPCWSTIHAFIGDEQSLDDHLSTFTAQICHLSTAWGSMGDRSLVLLDEFGAGTDPAQGAALAQAVLDELLERGVRVVATTHFPALKTYALSREGVRAASVLFDPVSKKPLFQLAYDQVGASQALDVARVHGLPDAVLRRAEQYLLLNGEDMSAVMDRLNALAIQREQELSILKVEQSKTREKRQAMQEQFARERERLSAEVREAAAKVVKDWQEGRAGYRHTLKKLAKARASLAAAQEVEHASPSPGFSAEALKPGQVIVHRSWNRQAVVREVDLRQNRARLDMNGVTLWADIKLLGPAETPNMAKNSGSVLLHLEKAPSEERISLLPLDVRGKRVDLAIRELGHYLDQAVLSGLESVEIVHGRGTGALRKEVHAFLKTFPCVASFALAPEDQGGNGVTVVIFK